MDQKQFVVSEGVLREILGYLESRPYREVAPLISALGQAQLATVIEGEAHGQSA